MGEINGPDDGGKSRDLLSILPNAVNAIVRLLDKRGGSRNPYFYWAIGLITAALCFGYWNHGCDTAECAKLGFYALLFLIGSIIAALVAITVIENIAKIQLRNKPRAKSTATTGKSSSGQPRKKTAKTQGKKPKKARQEIV